MSEYEHIRYPMAYVIDDTGESRAPTAEERRKMDQALERSMLPAPEFGELPTRAEDMIEVLDV